MQPNLTNKQTFLDRYNTVFTYLPCIQWFSIIVVRIKCHLDLPAKMIFRLENIFSRTIDIDIRYIYDSLISNGSDREYNNVNELNSYIVCHLIRDFKKYSMCFR